MIAGRGGPVPEFPPEFHPVPEFPGHASQIWRNGVQLPALDAHRVWRAHKKGETVVFQAEPE
jgi:hypothetical protein